MKLCRWWQTAPHGCGLSAASGCTFCKDANNMCNHLNARYQILIERWCDAQIQTSEIADTVTVTRDRPASIKVQVNCPDCDFSRRFNAYNPDIAIELYGRPTSTVDKWPTWLLKRLIPLRAQNTAVQEACLVCRVGPLKHASWD